MKPHSLLLTLSLLGFLRTGEPATTEQFVQSNYKQCRVLTETIVDVVAKDLSSRFGKFSSEEIQISGMVLAASFSYAYTSDDLSMLMAKANEGSEALTKALLQSTDKVFQRAQISCRQVLEFLASVRKAKVQWGKEWSRVKTYIQQYEQFLENKARWEQEIRHYENVLLPEYKKRLSAYEKFVWNYENRVLRADIPGDSHVGQKIDDVHQGDSLTLLSATGVVDFSYPSKDKCYGPAFDFRGRKCGGAYWYVEGVSGIVGFFASRDWYSSPQTGALRACAFDKEVFPADNRHHRDNYGTYSVEFKIFCPHRENGFYKNVYPPSVPALPRAKPTPPSRPRLSDARELFRKAEDRPELVRRVIDNLPPGEAIRKLARGFATQGNLIAWTTIPPRVDIPTGELSEGEIRDLRNEYSKVERGWQDVSRDLERQRRNSGS